MFIDENQMHMVLLFVGCCLGRYCLIVWAVQWFMLYHNMIKGKKAREKAAYARNMFIVIFIMLLLGVLLSSGFCRRGGWRFVF